jgi:P-type Ca2+ transporter type 2C
MDETPPPPWHSLGVEEALAQLGSGPEGLGAAEVERRRAEHGPNELPEGRKRSLLRMVFDQFANVMILVLLAAAVVSGVVGDPVDTIAIVVIVILNAVIGLVQEWRAEQAMSALRQDGRPLARVRRQGRLLDIPSAELVPGDIVLLEAGNVVPADLRVIERPD